MLGHLKSNRNQQEDIRRGTATAQMAWQDLGGSGWEIRRGPMPTALVAGKQSFTHDLLLGAFACRLLGSACKEGDLSEPVCRRPRRVLCKGSALCPLLLKMHCLPLRLHTGHNFVGSKSRLGRSPDSLEALVSFSKAYCTCHLPKLL